MCERHSEMIDFVLLQNFFLHLLVLFQKIVQVRFLPAFAVPSCSYAEACLLFVAFCDAEAELF